MRSSQVNPVSVDHNSNNDSMRDNASEMRHDPRHSDDAEVESKSDHEFQNREDVERIDGEIAKYDRLPPKPGSQQTGTIRGPYYYLWSKDRGVEPGFFGILEKGTGTILKKIIETAASSNDSSISDMIKPVMDSFEGSLDDTPAVISHFIKRELSASGKKKITPCARYLLAMLHEYQRPLVMVKMDYANGYWVSIEHEAAAKITPIENLKNNLGPLGPVASNIAALAYEYGRTTSYIDASVEAFREYLITEKIARNMLGKNRVQKVSLLVRENLLKSKTIAEMFSLGIEINQRFHDFSDHFNDGQRVSEEDHQMAIETEGLGETFALQVVSGNYDAFGSTGANGGYDDQGYFMIDLGKAFASESSAVVERTNSLLLVEQGKDAKNFSIYDNTTLVSRVRGLLLLGRVLGREFDVEIVAAHGQEFVQKYESISPISATLKSWRENLEKHFSTPEHREFLTKHLEAIDQIERRFKKNASLLLQKGEKYLTMSPTEIDILEGLTKITAPGQRTTKSVNKQVILNHIRLTGYDDRDIPQWTINARTNSEIILSGSVSQPIKIKKIQKYLGKLASIEMMGANQYRLAVKIENMDDLRERLADSRLANFLGLSLASQDPVEANLYSGLEIVENYFDPKLDDVRQAESKEDISIENLTGSYENIDYLDKGKSVEVKDGNIVNNSKSTNESDLVDESFDHMDIPENFQPESRIRLAPTEISQWLQSRLEWMAAMNGEEKIHSDITTGISSMTRKDGKCLFIMPAAHDHKKGEKASDLEGVLPLEQVLSKLPVNTENMTCVIPLTETNDYSFLNSAKRHWTLLVLQDNIWHLVDSQSSLSLGYFAYSTQHIDSMIQKVMPGTRMVTYHTGFQADNDHCGYHLVHAASEVFSSFMESRKFDPKNIKKMNDSTAGSSKRRDEFLFELSASSSMQELIRLRDLINASQDLVPEHRNELHVTIKRLMEVESVKNRNEIDQLQKQAAANEELLRSYKVAREQSEKQIDELQVALAAARQKVTEQATALYESKQDILVRDRKIAGLIEAQKNLDIEIQRLENESKHNEAIINDLQNRLDGTEKTVLQLRKQLEDAREENIRLNEEIEKLKSDLERIQQEEDKHEQEQELFSDQGVKDQLRIIADLLDEAPENDRFPEALLLCRDVLQDLNTQAQSGQMVSRTDCEMLYNVVSLLKKPEQPFFQEKLSDYAHTLVRSDKTSPWKRLGYALLAITGVALMVAGTVAMCSGLGFLPGSILAAAGFSAVSQAVAVGVSAGAICAGAGAATGGIFGQKQRTAREKLDAEVQVVVKQPKGLEAK